MSSGRLKMKSVTKEWIWILCSVVGSGLCWVVLVTGGVRPRQSLPLGIYAIVFPIAFVYLIRLAVWGIKLVVKR